MNIASIMYSIASKSLDIFISGCNAPHCKGCYNPELWGYNNGEYYEKKLRYIEDTLNDFDLLIDNIFIMGGEPIDVYKKHQNKLEQLYVFLKKYKKPIWTFTRYELELIPKFIKINSDYIKTGAYIPELKTENNIVFSIKLATSNQNIYKM